MKHYTIHVTGTVQGVFFRSNTQEKAQEFGLSGFVQNEADGSVLIEVEGEESSLQKLVEWCHHGPPNAQVDRVEMEESELVGFDDFSIQ